MLRIKNSELDQNCIKLGSENQQLLNEISSLRGLKQELNDKKNLLNERIKEEMAKERILMKKEIQAHQMQFDYEINEKDKSIKELKKQLDEIKTENEKSLSALQSELRVSKDTIVLLQRHESTIEEYETQLEEMQELRSELSTAQKINKRLEADITILESNQGDAYAL